MKKQQVKTGIQWLKIGKLYRQAFPSCERKPLTLIYKMQQKGVTDVWYFEEHGKFIGLAATINTDHIILLDYLAVSKKVRNCGYGSQILKDLQTHYEPKGLLVEIECVYQNAANYEERKHRKQFYLSNNMKELQVYAKLFGVDMELLGYNCQLNFDGYVSLYRETYGEFAVKNIKKIGG